MGKVLYTLGTGRAVRASPLPLPALRTDEHQAIACSVRGQHAPIAIDDTYAMRPLTAADAMQLSAALCDPAHPHDPAASPASRLSFLLQPFDTTAASICIDTLTTAQRNGTGLGMAIVQAHNGSERIVGLYYAFIKEQGSAMLGVGISPAHQGKRRDASGHYLPSVYRLAESAFINYLFDTVGIKRVLGTTALDNTIMLAIWAQRGQQRIGYSANESDGTMLPRHISILTAEAWARRHTHRTSVTAALTAAVNDMLLLQQALYQGSSIGDNALTSLFNQHLTLGITAVRLQTANRGSGRSGNTTRYMPPKNAENSVWCN